MGLDISPLQLIEVTLCFVLLAPFHSAKLGDYWGLQELTRLDTFGQDFESHTLKDASALLINQY